MNDDFDGHDEVPVDLSSLDPAADPAHLARIGRRLSQAAADELARRRSRLDVWSCLASWRKPVLAGAGIIAAAASLMLATVPRTSDALPTLAEAAGVPSAWARLTDTDQAPAPEVLLQLEQGNP